VTILQKPRDTVGNWLLAFGVVGRTAARLWIFLIPGALLAPIWTVRYPPIVAIANGR